jgi:hypothetical protein
MVLAGHLGVLRINKDNSETADGPYGTLVSDKGTLGASWDTKELEVRFGKSHRETSYWRYSTYGTRRRSTAKPHTLDVFYVSVRIMNADPDLYDWSTPYLTGLLLLPTGMQDGEYYRVGQFEYCNRSKAPEYIALFDHLTPSTRIVDKRYFVSKQKRGQYTISVI